MRIKRWTGDELDRLSQLYWKGYTNQEIAEDFGCKVKRIKDALTNHNIAVRAMAAERRSMSMLRKNMPKEYRKPTPLPRMKIDVPEPSARGIDFMQALEENTCVWLDGKLKACGHGRTGGSRYCKYHYERSLKRNEVA